MKKNLTPNASKKKTVGSHNYFHTHECHIPAEKLSAYAIKCGRLKKMFLDLTTVHSGDVRAINMYRSYAALCAEKYRQYKLYPSCILHPFSRLRLYLEVIFSISIFSASVLYAAHLSEPRPKFEDYHNYEFVLNLITVGNIIANFLTGYIAGKSEKYAVLDLKSIALRYIKSWFIIDVVASIGCLPHLYCIEIVQTKLILRTFKMCRVPILLQYLRNILVVVKPKIYAKTVIEIFILLTLYVIWNIYLQFAVEYLIEDSFTPVSYRNCSWIRIAGLEDGDHKTRLVFALYRAVAMLRTNTNMNYSSEHFCSESFTIVAWVIAKLLVMHCILKYVITLFCTLSARTRFYMMTKQVETYMIQRKFPPRIRKKILKFYAIRFQSNFFTESRMLGCLSGQLREDTLMHTGRQLVRDLSILKQLPRTLYMQIGSMLEVVIFIAGDIIYKINTVGDCLYFIDKGTVAFYTSSGKEFCHLEDGEYFGFIDVIMNNHFRTTSAIAVTNCELFRLNKQNFDSTIACYPTVYEDMKRLAIMRMEAIQMLDEHHRAELREMGKYKRKTKI